MLKTLGHKQSVSNLISKGPTDLVLVSDALQFKIQEALVHDEAQA